MSMPAAPALPAPHRTPFEQQQPTDIATDTHINEIDLES